jgi:hypothetical protein
MSDSETISKLVSVLKKYFSPENLRNDMNLTQILARQQFVTLDEIARLSLVKKTLDAADIPDAEQIENILRAIRQMDDILTLYDNDQYVIPKIPENRTTLIIRDLPEDVDIEEIKTLLNNDKCRDYQEIRPDCNKTWFVTYETEEECVRAATWIQLSAKLRGEKCRCRIKSQQNQPAYFGGPQQGNPYANMPSPYYPPPHIDSMDPRNDTDFVNWLENPKAKRPKGKGKSKRSAEDENVDYDGIFKLINRQTFEMVVSRFQGSFPEGPKKLENANQHRAVLENRPDKGFMTLEEIDL